MRVWETCWLKASSEPFSLINWVFSMHTKNFGSSYNTLDIFRNECELTPGRNETTPSVAVRIFWAAFLGSSPALQYSMMTLKECSSLDVIDHEVWIGDDWQRLWRQSCLRRISSQLQHSLPRLLPADWQSLPSLSYSVYFECWIPFFVSFETIENNFFLKCDALLCFWAHIICKPFIKGASLLHSAPCEM